MPKKWVLEQIFCNSTISFLKENEFYGNTLERVNLIGIMFT